MSALHELGTAKKAKLGTGQRFASLKRSLASKGATDAGTLAAFVGIKKYGAGKMAAMAHHSK